MSLPKKQPQSPMRLARGWSKLKSLNERRIIEVLADKQAKEEFSFVKLIIWLHAFIVVGILVYVAKLFFAER